MKVSILMITYNQQKFISQAIESVLMQETDFDFELVIGEDCSTDRTREIVTDYQKKYPNIIRLLLPKKNLGMMQNFVQTFKACNGQYIAILEGDDYWTSPLKLQRQADFLDNHPECSICCNTTIALNESDPDRSYVIPPPEYQKEVQTLEDLLKLNFVATPSVMFRNSLFPEFPQWFCELELGDYPLHILNAQYGCIGYIPEQMSVYRIHSASNFSSRKIADNLKAVIKLYEVINEHLEYKYDQLIKEMIRYYQILLKNHE